MCFLNLGTRSLHPAHTAFKNGISELDLKFDNFSCDLGFFFHISSASRENYGQLESLTNVVAGFAMKHGPTRWLNIKYVAVRVLEQMLNSKEYFY